MVRIRFNLVIYFAVLTTVSILTGYGCSNKSSPGAVNDPPPTPSQTLGWTSWQKRSAPIFTGQYPLVGDASVIKEGSSYRMFYTCFDPFRSPQGPEICEALSSDGLVWNYAPIGNPQLFGRILQTGPGVWDNAHETSFILKFNTSYYLYFIGYVDNGGVYNSIPSSIGFAQSNDGLNFVRATNPILTGTSRGYDADVMTSPSIVDSGNGTLLMVYSGFCATNCNHTPGTNLLGATSTNGINWTKLPEPIIQSSEIPWPNQGLAESEIVKGPDGYYYLFMTVLQGTNPHQIGVARSLNYTGPWQVSPQPIVTSGGAGSFDEAEVVAPSVLIEGNKVRMWFHGRNRSTTSPALAIGYAESIWPLFSK